MTEDMVREKEEMLSRIGTGPEASRLRARMQSASLLSGEFLLVISTYLNRHASFQI